jgi:hypothetical protein
VCSVNTAILGSYLCDDVAPCGRWVVWLIVDVLVDGVWCEAGMVINGAALEVDVALVVLLIVVTAVLLVEVVGEWLNKEVDGDAVLRCAIFAALLLLLVEYICDVLLFGGSCLVSNPTNG